MSAGSGLEEYTLPFADTVQKVRVQFVRAGTDVFIELIEPISPSSPVDGFLDKQGGGLHHLAFEVPDFEEAIAQVTARGGRLVGRPFRGFEKRQLVFAISGGNMKLLVELVGPKE